MPLYNLACRNALDAGVRLHIATAITQTHCQQTGAPAQFVNVAFLDDYPLPTGQKISVIGGVRTGGNRTADMIETLRLALQKAIAQAAGLSSRQVAVSLIGVPSAWIMEGGRIMPEPGAEDAWLAHSPH